MTKLLENHPKTHVQERFVVVFTWSDILGIFDKKVLM